MTLETPALYAARPRLRVDQVDEIELGESLLSVLVTEDVDGLSRCEALFGNWGDVDGEVGYVLSNRATLDFGRDFTVRMGDEGTEADVFSGRITGIESHYPQDRPPELAILAEDRFQDLRMTRRTRTFEDQSDEDVLRTVAADHGLTADVDIDTTQHRIIAQLNQSDLAFIRDRARRIDAELWMHGTTLHCQSRARRDGGSVKLTYQRNLREFTVLADLATQRTSIAVSGWDVAAKEAIDVAAGATVVNAELNGTQGSIALLESAFGDRADRLTRAVPLTSAEAQAMADAAMRGTARRFVTGRGIAEGDGRIRVGTFVDLVGLGPAFGGTYYVTAVEHAFDGVAGYVTHFAVERPGLEPV